MYNLDNCKLVITTTDYSITFNSDDIIRDSIKYDTQLLNGLNPSSSSVSITVYNSDKIEAILSHDAIMEAILYADDSTIIYRGILSNKITYTVTENGISAVKLTLEDALTRKLKKSYSDYTEFYKGSIKDLVIAIAEKCSISYSFTGVEESFLTSSVSAVINANTKCSDVLQNALKEVCGVYYASCYGDLCIYRVPRKGEVSSILTALATQDGTAVKLSKSLRKYSKVRTATETYEEISNLLIYKDISGQSSSFPNCNITIEAGKTYPEAGVGYYDVTDLSEGKEIVNIEDLVPEVESNGTLKVEISKHGPTQIAVLLTNTGTVATQVTKLQATATATRVLSDEICYDSIDGMENETYDITCSYVHSKDQVASLASFYKNYYEFCNQEYEFYIQNKIWELTSAKTAILPFKNMHIGDVINLRDTSMSGLNVNILITGASIESGSDLITYKGVSYSQFSTDLPTGESVYRPPVVIPDGAKGDDGRDGLYFSLDVSPLTYNIDYRDSESKTTISIVATVVDKSRAAGTLYPSIKINDTDMEATHSTSGEYTSISSYNYYIPYNSDLGIYTITSEYDDLSRTVKVTGIDITSYYEYLGKYESEPKEETFPGDCYFNTSNNILYIRENGQWLRFSESARSDEYKSMMAGKAQEDVLSTIPANSVSQSEYGYFRNIISDTVTTSVITMTQTGIIQSAGIDSSSVGSDGYLTSDGYRLEGNTAQGRGVLRAKNAYLDTMNAKNGSLANVSISGELKGKYINTIAPSTSTFSVSSTAMMNKQYLTDTVNKALWDRLNSDGGQFSSFYDNNSELNATTVVRSGSFFGTSFQHAVALATSMSSTGVTQYGELSGNGWSSHALIVYNTPDPNYPNAYLAPGIYRDVSTANRVLLYSMDGSTVLLDTSNDEFSVYGLQTAFYEPLKTIPSGGTLKANGTVKKGSQQISGDMYVMRNGNSIQFYSGSTYIEFTIKGDSSGYTDVIPWSQGDTKVAVSIYNTMEGIQTSNIYPMSTSTALGSITNRFHEGYISYLYGTTIKFDQVWGAVAN